MLAILNPVMDMCDNPQCESYPHSIGAKQLACPEPFVVYSRNQEQRAQLNRISQIRTSIRSSANPGCRPLGNEACPFFPLLLVSVETPRHAIIEVAGTEFAMLGRRKERQDTMLCRRARQPVLHCSAAAQVRHCRTVDKMDGSPPRNRQLRSRRSNQRPDALGVPAACGRVRPRANKNYFLFRQAAEANQARLARTPRCQSACRGGCSL